MAKIVCITAKKDGFRRAGMAHSAAATDHAAEEFDAKRLALLKAEPMLVVQEIDLPDEPLATDDPGKGTGKGAGKR